MRIIKGDTVLISSGKDKNRKAKVLRAFPKTGRILVEGVNMKKVHKRPRREGEKGEVVAVAAPFNASKAKLICPKCAEAVRTSYKVEAGKKARICKKCGAEI